MIIGLTGYAGSGKDEAAKALIAEGFTRVAFADALRDVLYDMNPSVGTAHLSAPFQDYVDVHGWDWCKATIPQVRVLLQNLGVAVRTHIGDDAWVRAALRKTIEPVDYVFTDVRFPNEADAIRSFGGCVVRILRPGVGPVNSHESETAMDREPVALTVVNDGTIEQLHRKMHSFLETR
jgi:hypothetical protein